MGAVSYCLSYLCLPSGEVMLSLSSLPQKWIWVWKAVRMPKPLEKKILPKVWVPCSCLGLADGKYFPVDCHPPWYKEGKTKMRLSLRFTDLPVLSWLREVTSQFQSQRTGFIPFSFSAEAQGEKLWLGGSTREAPPIRQVYQRNRT